MIICHNDSPFKAGSSTGMTSDAGQVPGSGHSTAPLEL